MMCPKVSLSIFLMAGFVLAGCSPKTPTVLRIEQALDGLAAGVDAGGGDCKRMAAAVQAPADEMVLGLKDLKKNKERLPASTKLKFARLASTLQKMRPCAEAPEMQAVFQKLTVAAGP